MPFESFTQFNGSIYLLRSVMRSRIQGSVCPGDCALGTNGVRRLSSYTLEEPKSRCPKKQREPHNTYFQIGIKGAFLIYSSKNQRDHYTTYENQYCYL